MSIRQFCFLDFKISMRGYCQKCQEYRSDNGMDAWEDTLASANQRLLTGARPTGAATQDRIFDGIIDEVCIYNRALTADEIKDLYKYGPYTEKLREKEPVDGGTESEEGAQQIADRLLALLKDPKIQIGATGRLRMDVDLGDVVTLDLPDSDVYGNFMIYEMRVRHPADELSEVSYTFGSESPSLEAELASLQAEA